MEEFMATQPEVRETDLKRKEKSKEIVKTEGKKNWTIMVYLGGDNNLAEEMVYALKGMYSVGSTKECQIYALFDAGLSPVVFPIPDRKGRSAFLEQIRNSADANSFVENSILLRGPVSEND